MGTSGLEPPTSRLSGVRSNHLSYAPNDTYTNESIITYTEIFNSIADAFEAAKK